MKRSVLVSGIVAMVFGLHAADAAITNFQVASNVAIDGYFGFYGDNVAYKGTDGYVKIKNLSSGATYNVAVSPNTMIDISASYVTYMNSAGYGDIWAAQINPDGSLASGLIKLAGPGDQWWPTIYDNTVVWMDKRDGQWEIYSATLAGSSVSQTVRLTYDSNHDIYPQIYGDNVFWQRRNASNQTTGLFGVNTKTGENYTIYEGDAFGKGIFEDTIAYNADTPADVYLYDISTNTSRRITNESSSQYYADIYGDTVVWQDNRNGNWDIFSYNRVTGQQTQLTDNELDQTMPVIFGNTVLWNDCRDGGSIYGTQITPVPAPSALPLVGSGMIALAGFRRKLLR
ncbi:MAG: hypothetical protein JW955_17855 [Sedimentisphaerales bacterium]|nr:hypothetical protein [Sedimentisphaerales bacterium]